MRFALVLLPLTLGACGVSQEKFSEEMVAASCNKMSECFGAEMMTAMGFASVDECIAKTTSSADDKFSEENCPNYDAGLAKQCLDQFDAASCDAIANGSADISACETMCGETSEDSDA